ncbi:hypothetical protein, partial [Streptococcus suis]|uniref:hypothetical protein n=1 Tax=Streptococcus suis TaxID=1307 RepID=UPI001EE0E7E6
HLTKWWISSRLDIKNDNEVRKAPDALERVPEMLDTPPNRYHCISKALSVCWGLFWYPFWYPKFMIMSFLGYYF